MYYKEARLELRGKKKIELEDYFQNLSLGSNDICLDDHQIKHEDRMMTVSIINGNGWKVEIGPEKMITLGVILLPSVTLCFRSQENLFDSMLSDFRLRFLSAGG